MNKRLSIVVTEPFADEIIQDLVSKKAVKILEEENEADDYEIPEWQKREIDKRLKEFERNPDAGMTLEEFEKIWVADEKD